MLILAVDTSTQAGSLAVLRDADVLGVVSTHTEETYSSRMFRHLDFLLREMKLEMNQFDLYAVAAGPGSFTGLRVGLTAVKGWAEVHGKSIAAVSGLEAVAAQARAQQKFLVPVIDARRAQIYAGLYERAGNRLARRGDEVVMQPAEFLAILERETGPSDVAFVTPTPEVLAGPLAQSVYRAAPVEKVSTVLAPFIGRLGHERALRGELVDSLSLDANYIRRSDAELLWKSKSAPCNRVFRGTRKGTASAVPNRSKCEGVLTPEGSALNASPHSQIRALATGDVDAILAIQSSCPEAAQWPRADYERVCAAGKSGMNAWVAVADGAVAGFVLTRRAADELEILNLAVAPVARRKGIASRLLRAALEPAQGAGARRAFLEVRESNAGAIAFYSRHGFAPSGRRPNYYSAPVEAALILSRAI